MYRCEIGFRLFLLLIVCLIPAQYCESAPESGGTDLVLWNLPVRPARGGDHAAEIARLDMFLDTHPHINVKSGGGVQLQRFGMGTREFLMSQAAGIGPDAVSMKDVDLQDYITRNFLLPLDDFLERDGLLDEALNDKLSSYYIRDGHIYALAIERDTYLLVYRRDLFQRAGLDPDRPPKTWEEFLRYAEALTDPPNNCMGFVLPSLETKGQIEAGGFLEVVFALNGVEVIKQRSDGKWVADFADDPRAIQAMKFVAELVGRRVVRDRRKYRGLSATSGGNVDDANVFVMGEAAMMLQSPEWIWGHQARGLRADQIGLALIPLGPSGDGYVPLTADFMGINSLSPTKERREAAWAWMKFRQDPDFDKLAAKIRIGWGETLALDPGVLEDDPALKEYLRVIPAQWREVYKHRFDNAGAFPVCSEQRQLRLDYLARVIAELRKNPDRDPASLLKETQDAINKELLGAIPAETHRKRKNLATLIIVGVALSIVGGMSYGLRGMLRSLRDEHSSAQSGQRPGSRRVYMLAFLFMLPAVGSVILWAYVPLVRGAMIAFQDYQIVGPVHWTGLDNFIVVLTDKLFWISLLRSFQYAALSISLGFVAPICLAFLLSEVPKGKVLFRVLYYLPSLTPALVISFLWYWIYNPNPTGLLNTIIGAIGRVFGAEIGPFNYLGSESLAMLSVIIPSVWAGMGGGSIIYLAALHGIPEEMYEAADLDGAGMWSKIWHISIPTIKPLIVIGFVGAVVASFYATQSIFVMTMGGPGNATYVTGLYIFFNSFVWLKFGKATAAAWILGSLLIGFMVYQLRILKEMRFRTAAGPEE